MTNPRPQECRGCPLDEVASGFAHPEGSGSLKVLLTGEALGEQEAKDGLPFRPYAPAGAILQRTLKALGIDRQQVVINNIAMCRPPNNRFEYAEWEVWAANHCRVHYWKVLQRFQPRVIVALGNVPLKHLTGYTGEKKTITNVRGFYLDGLRHPGIPVIGSYHPSHIQRDKPNLLGVLQTDILRAKLLAEAGGRFTRPERKYTVFPSVTEAFYWLEDLRLHPELLVTYDIETMESFTGTSEDDLRALPDGRLEWRKTKAEFEEMPEHLIADRLDEVEEPTEQLMIGETRITQIQFSARENEAIVLPFTEGYIQLAQEVLALPNPKMGHNARLFDDPLLRQAGVHIAGRRDDSMDCLRADVKVRLFDGTTRRISDIVDNKLPVTLLGMNEQDEQIPVVVRGWHKKKVPNQEWVHIKTDGTRQPLYLTPEHLVWTKSGWNPANSIVVGDLMALPNRGGDDAILGSLLGDGYYNEKARALYVMHSTEQRAWAEAKARHFGSVLHSRNKIKHSVVYFTRICSRRWRGIYNKEGKKRFLIPSPAALAVWYCDDGNLAGNGRKGSKWLGRIRIPLQKFEDPELVFRWLRDEFGPVTLSKDLSTACLGVEAVYAFMKVVASWVHPSMEYKLLPEFRGRYNGWLEKPVPQWAVVTSVKTAPRAPKYDTRYCVSVDHPTMRFFAEGGLIHNCWHHLQADLPKGLQYVCSFYIPEAEPWKHTSGSNEGQYGGDDVAHLRKFGPRILQQLRDRGLWYGYDRQVRELGYVFDRATDLGIPMNNQKLDVLDAEIAVAQKAVGEEIQGLVPDDLKNTEPKNGYVNPKVAEKYRALPIGEGEKWIERQFLGPDAQMISRWCRLQPFLPNSSQQILRYIKWRLQEDIEIRVRGYQAQPRYQGQTLSQLEDMASRNTKWKVPKKFREDKETTAKTELVRLGRATGDELFEKVIQYREYVKVRKTYVQGWRPKADGRVHGIFKFGPATGQMSSSNPNVQNSLAPKGPEGSHQRKLAEAFRQAIEAPPGFKLVTFDYKAFHVLTTGFEARCPTWMRLARLDMHSFVTGMFIREPWEKWLDLPDEELAEILSRIKNQSTPRYEQLQTGFIRDRKAKPADLAIGFGARERKIYDLNQESFANLGEVKTFFSLLRQIGKEVFVWQDSVRRECHSINKGYLKTAYGYMRWFHDVYHWSSVKGAMEPGKDHEAVVAYRPANDAFGIKKDVELWLGDEGLDVKFGFSNDVHDELFFVCPDQHVEECLHLVKARMEAPSSRLVDPVLAPQGLWCEVEAKVGQNWGTWSKANEGGMQKVKIPKAVIASGV